MKDATRARRTRAGNFGRAFCAIGLILNFCVEQHPDDPVAGVWILGSYLLLCIPFAVWLWWYEKKTRNKEEASDNTPG